MRESARILIADDNDAYRATLAAALRADGYVTVEASCGREALDRAEEFLFGTDSDSVSPDPEPEPEPEPHPDPNRKPEPKNSEPPRRPRIRVVRLALTILDVRMPDMTGLDVLRALRARKARVPAIFLTSHPTEALRRQALALGAFALWAKSRRLIDLRRAIARLVAEQQLLEDAPPPPSTGDSREAEWF